MRLFDDLPRTLPKRVDRSVPTWDFLNLSSASDVGVVRDELERWFAKYPEPEQAELAKRFRTENGGDTLAPFLELFLHEMLLRFEYDVTVHPEVPGSSRRPDFKVVVPGGPGFYVEATVAYESSDKRKGAEARKTAVFEGLDKLKDPRVTLSVEHEGDPATPPKVSAWLATIESDLSSISDDEISSSDLARPIKKWDFEHRGFRCTVGAYADPDFLSEGRTGPAVGIKLGETRWVTLHRSIRKAITDKAGHYGVLDLPFVVSVLPVGRSGFGGDHEDVMSALLGDGGNVYAVGPDGLPDEGRFVRDRNGAWNGPKGPQNTRVSACLIVERLRPWSVPRADAVLYLNPWASCDAASVLPQLPRFARDGEKHERSEGATVSAIFGLPVDWPGPHD